MLKLLTLNIEGHKHLDTILPFLVTESPDVACFQEIFEADIPAFEEKLGFKLHFFPMVTITQPHKHGQAPLGNWGVAWGTRFEHTPVEAYYYAGSSQVPENYDLPTDVSRVFAWATVTVPAKNEFEVDQRVTIGTTHFTWSPKGETTDVQRTDFAELAKQLDLMEDLVLCGDFNAPRGRESFTWFSDRLIDHLPADVATTIDGNLHYAGDIQVVVDTIFSTQQYAVSQVRVVSGVSDHMAVTGHVSRKKLTD